MTFTVYALIIGYIADLIIGDPYCMWHPVCFIGNMISFFEKILRKLFRNTEAGQLAAGAALVILVLFFSAIIPGALLYAAFKIHWLAGLILESYMCYSIFAVKCLKTESMKVHKALKEGGVEEGRKAVSMIVGRDTQSLDEIGVVKATVETVAENTTDGVIAPLIYMAIGGPVLGYFYKAVNTMDSMVGYKNDKYLYFGRAAAKLDDVMNFIPARISAILMILGAYFTGFDGKQARKIFKRDRYNHASPNSAQTESVMAGALNIQLAGNAYYFGKLYRKPTIGDDNRTIEADDIRRANKLMYGASILGAVVFIAIRIAVETVISHG